MKCKYCGSNFTNGNENCPKCGAPCYYEDGFERCECGLILPKDFVRFEIGSMICHKCFGVFKKAFYAKYSYDKRYPNGQITHFFITKHLSCPHCGTSFSGHEFYHSVYALDKALRVAKTIKAPA